MKEQIYTIPINDAFDRKEGCPLCTLEADLNRNSLEYVLGAAMMEPNVRIETNRLGFCGQHMRTMAGMKNRLSLALMQESHLNELHASIAACAGGRSAEKGAKDAARIAESCFICARVERFMEKYIENVIFLWKTEPEFRQKLSLQPQFCLGHFSSLITMGKKILSRKEFDGFAKALGELELGYLDGLRGRVSQFCKSFDHRFAGMDLGDAKDAVEQANLFLNGKLRGGEEKL